MRSRFKKRPWVIDKNSGTIKRQGVFSRPHRLDPRLFKVLALLVEKAGVPVSPEEILEKVWEGRVVSADSVSTAIYQLRKNLGEDAKDPRNLFTVPHEGYMWRADELRAEQSANRTGARLTWVIAAATCFGAAVLVSGPDQEGGQNENMIFLAPMVNLTGDQALNVSSDAVDATFVSALLRLNPEILATRNEDVSSRFTLQSEVVYCDSGPTLVLTLIDSERQLYLWSEYYDFYGDFQEPSMVEHAARRVTQAISRI